MNLSALEILSLGYVSMFESTWSFSSSVIHFIVQCRTQKRIVMLSVPKARLLCAEIVGFKLNVSCFKFY